VNDEHSPSEIDFIRIHFQLRQYQIDFLNTIDKDNISRALRILIDKYIKQTKMLSFQKYLPTLGGGLMLIVIGTILPNIWVSLTSIFTGVFMMGFSVYMYNEGKLKYEENK